VNHLHQVILGNIVAIRNFLDGCQFVTLHREVDQNTQGIVGVTGDMHLTTPIQQMLR
jgi:hypothetical protein